MFAKSENREFCMFSIATFHLFTQCSEVDLINPVFSILDRLRVLACLFRPLSHHISFGVQSGQIGPQFWASKDFDYATNFNALTLFVNQRRTALFQGFFSRQPRPCSYICMRWMHGEISEILNSSIVAKGYVIGEGVDSPYNIALKNGAETIRKHFTKSHKRNKKSEEIPNI